MFARTRHFICARGPFMETAKPTLIRETFPVGPLQCNCNDE